MSSECDCGDECSNKCISCTDDSFDHEKFAKECMEKYGWYIHYVMKGDSSSPTGMNIHTHGIKESYNHNDFQIVLPIPQEVCKNILQTMIENIKSGTLYEADKKYENILEGYFVTFINVVEGDRELLRLIFPDQEGNLDRDSFTSEGYDLQYKVD